MPQTNTPDTPLPHRDTLQQLLRDVNDLRRSHKDQLGPARKYRVHTIQDLLDAMTTETARALIKEYHYGETEKVFFLTEGQLRTVRALDPEQEVAPSLEKLQGLAPAPGLLLHNQQHPQRPATAAGNRPQRRSGLDPMAHEHLLPAPGTHPAPGPGETRRTSGPATGRTHQESRTAPLHRLAHPRRHSP